MQAAIAGEARDRRQTFTARFTGLEQQRLEALALEWLALEKQRAPFTVVATEAREAVSFGGLTVSAIVDRLDELADGTRAVIDYKTGSPRLSQWFGARPDEPQLPLYSAARERVAAVLFARVRRGDMKFIGAAQHDGIVPDVAAFDATREAGPRHLGRAAGRLARGARRPRAVVPPRRRAGGPEGPAHDLRILRAHGAVPRARARGGDAGGARGGRDMSAARILDAAERTQALDPQHSFIVQAPAGSGKTELLTNRYLVLLACVEHPEEVVAITFTRKAASEMRQRVLLALDAAAHGEKPAPAHKALTWELARQVLARDTARAWNLPANPGRLRIGTIDAFCAALTRQMPLLSRLGAPPATVEDAQPLYREAARATIGLLETGGSWSPAIERLLLHLDNRLPAVEDLIAQMLARRDQWLRHLADRGSERLRRETLETALRHVIGDALGALRAAMAAAPVAELLALARQAAANLKADESDSEICACLDLTGLPGTAPDDLPAWRGLAQLLLARSSGTWRKEN